MNSPTTVTLIALPDALPSCLSAWEDLFTYANRLSVRRGGREVFSWRRWAPSTEVPERTEVVLVPVRTSSGPTGREVDPTPRAVTRTLRDWHREGTLVGAVCVGVFCVAEAGLLDGKRATTHWLMAEEFRRAFPRVHLDTQAFMVEEPGLLLGGGMTAYFDLGLRLVRRFAGPVVAKDCAAVFVLEPERRFQSPFTPADYASEESDPVLAQAMTWLASQAELDFGVREWANAVAVEKRTLERRSLVAWGHGPAERLRQIRLDRARLLVLGATLPWDEVARRCGYHDPGALRRLFLERFGQTPGEYRRRFGAR